MSRLPKLAAAVIVATTERVFRENGLADMPLSRCHAGLGLAGANVPSVAEAFRAKGLPFAAYGLETDAVTACRGAFAGGDGAIAILGTGSAYAVRSNGAVTLLGGEPAVEVDLIFPFEMPADEGRIGDPRAVVFDIGQLALRRLAEAFGIGPIGLA